MLRVFQKDCLHTPYGGQQLLTQGLSEYFFKDADKIRSPQMQTSKVQMTKSQGVGIFPSILRCGKFLERPAHASCPSR